MIDLFASEPHFLRHLAPTWEALPEGMRGRVYDPSTLPPWSLEAQGRRVLVASMGDLAAVYPRRVILSEHGAGQSYAGDQLNAVTTHRSYAGGDGRETVDLFLVPGPHPAARNRARWPGTPVAEVGCPALDGLVGLARPPGRTVVVSTHWDDQTCPESASALGYFMPGIIAACRSYQVIGHAHPRARHEARALFWAAGIPFFDTAEEVLGLASAIVVDNSSMGFEFAALGRAVVWLNAPSYRRFVNHGLRFWDAVDTGVQCDRPQDLPERLEEALSRPPASEDLIHRVYTYTDGLSAQRAADAILELEAARPLKAVSR
jgi:hypothetical protein